MSGAAIDFCRYAQRRHSGQTQLARDCYFLRSCLCAILAIFLVADVHTGSWKAFPLPEGIKDLTQGPAVAALLVF